MINVGEPMGPVTRLVKKKGYSFEVLFDENGAINRDYQVPAHPFKYLLDKEGRFFASGLGYREWFSDDIKTLIENLLSE